MMTTETQNEYGQIAVLREIACDFAGKEVEDPDSNGRAPIRNCCRNPPGQKRGYARMDDAGEEA
jgi:hypothetical protein